MDVEEPLKRLPDGRGAWVYPLTFGRARLVVGDEYFLDDGW